jgi:AcrR family transcriptional regulator
VAAIEVFARLGYGGASMRELAAAANMEKGHISYYFPSKELLLFEVVDELCTRSLARLEEWVVVPPSFDGLLELFRAHIRMVISDIDQTRVAYENFRFLSEHRRKVIVDKRRKYEDLLCDYVERCRPTMSIDPDTTTRLLVFSALGVMNWPYQWVTDRGPEAREALAERLALRAIAALQPVTRPIS